MEENTYMLNLVQILYDNKSCIYFVLSISSYNSSKEKWEISVQTYMQVLKATFILSNWDCFEQMKILQVMRYYPKTNTLKMIMVGVNKR